MTGFCQQCGAVLPADDPLGGGQCAACLWKELMPAASRSGPAYRDMVPGHEIVEEIGRGGMGLVYRARQITPAREVALKMLLPLDSGQAELRDRFRGEARALAELEHPAILPLYLVGEADGLPYFTMKLAAGGTLAERISRDGKWNTKEAAELMVLVGSGVQFAHEHGVIHRDLKPGNVLFDDAGRAYVADFGLAKFETDAVSHARSAGILGTPAYLAPEIAAQGGRLATTLSDVYSLGAILYELLAGRPPFVDDDIMPLLRKITDTEPASLSTLNGQVPRDLEIICHKCLRKAPGDRYPSVRAFTDDLGRWLRGEPILARQITPAQRLVKWARRRPALAALSASLVLVLIGTSVWTEIKNQQLEKALGEAREARDIANSRATFIVDLVEPMALIGRLDLLNDTFAYLVESDTATDEASTRRRLGVLVKFGESLSRQGESAKATTMLKKAVELASTLPPSRDATFQKMRARAQLAMAEAESQGAYVPVKELASLEKACESLEPFRTVSEKETYAAIVENLAVLGLHFMPASGDVRDYCVRSTALKRELLESEPESAARRLALSSALLQQTRLWEKRGLSARQRAAAEEADDCFARALASANESIELMRSLCSRAGAYPAWQRTLAIARRDAAGLIAHTSDAARGEALRQLEEVCETFELLTRSDPADWESRLEAAASHSQTAAVAALLKDDSTRERHLLRQASIVEELYQQGPQMRQWALARINASLELGRWKLERNDQPEAIRLFNQSL